MKSTTTTVNIEWANSGSSADQISVFTEAAGQLHSSIHASVSVGREQFESWKRSSIETRISVVKRFRKNLASRCQEIAQQLCGSRSAEEFLTSEIIPLLDGCKFLEKNAPSILRTRTLGSWRSPMWLRGIRHEIRREPLGVVLVVGPSNYPLFLPAIQVLQALVAGNSILLKPAPSGEAAALLFSGLLVEAGLPKGLLQILPTSPEAVRVALSAGVDKVVVTGSFQTGQQVLLNAAMSATPSVVELSGSDGVLVLPDADLTLAAESIAFGLTLNSGRTCIAPRRAFVWKSVANEFKQALLRSFARLQPVNLPDHQYPALKDAIMDAVRSGARVLNGALRDGGLKGPIVLGDLSSDNAFASRENWGPILSIIEVSDAAEAIAAFNDSNFGLGASIFSRSEQAALQIADRLYAGSICINDLIIPTADGRLPFAGRKRSGFGATRGPEGLLEMTALKVVSVRTGRTRFHLKPPMPNQFEVLSAYAESAYGSRTRGLSKLFAAIRLAIKKNKLTA